MIVVGTTVLLCVIALDVLGVMPPTFQAEVYLLVAAATSLTLGGGLIWLLLKRDKPFDPAEPFT